MVTRTELEPDPVVRLLTQATLAGVMVFGSAFTLIKELGGALPALREFNEVLDLVRSIVRDEPNRQVEITVGRERPKVGNPSPGLSSSTDNHL
jgi:hypothetical protein